MKKIIFVRHGRAEEGSPEITDFERSLTTRGKTTTRQMAKKLKTKEKSIGTAVTSPAFRAYETALIFTEEFGVSSNDVILNSDFYDGINLKNLTKCISGIREEEDVITIFGHNPTISDISNDLTKEGGETMPKSGIACISFNVQTWSEVGRNKGKTEYFLKPVKHNE